MSLQDYPCEDAAGGCPEAACGEERAAVGVCADAGGMYVGGWYAALDQLEAVAQRQVDMPFHFSPRQGCCPDVHRREAARYSLHVETCVAELVIHLVAHLERRERYARADGCAQRLRARRELVMHRRHHCLRDAFRRPAPPGMNRCGAMMLMVVYDNRYAVGGGDPDADAAHAGDERIGAVYE